VRVEKTVRLGGDRRTPSLELEVVVDNHSPSALDVRLGVEFTLTMLGGGSNPSAWWEVDGARAGHDGSGAAPSIDRLAQGNDHIGVALETEIEPAASAAWAPIETISNSEAGFERVYQGSCLILSWPLRLAPGASFSVRIGSAAATTRDRAAEELATVG
jgi:alpha-amylase